jgi:hypothetical protein
MWVHLFLRMHNWYDITNEFITAIDIYMYTT